jgi:protein HOOK3
MTYMVTNPPKAESERTIKTLQRENGLMSTAWYDLTSRLQSNHVVLQRRSDMPKSWLNKQRHLVNGRVPFLATSMTNSQALLA